jgi:dTDP-4-dehydrorhamnose 3,5-epimerase
LKVRETRLPGVLLVEPDVYADERGEFLETYHRERFMALGIVTDFVQDNLSRSRKGTVRGLHYQTGRGQAKLVSVVRGSIWDVVVDIRAESRSFGEHEVFLLDDVSRHQLLVPTGFAHGFAALSALADVSYKVSSYYDAAAERGIAWNDADLGIKWPVDKPIVSLRDAANPPLRAVLQEDHGR